MARTKHASWIWSAAILVLASAGPSAAQIIDDLIGYRAGNRADAASRSIAQMIADRSDSAAVRDRARSITDAGPLLFTVEEILSDIGADRQIARLGAVAASAPPVLEPPAGPIAIATPTPTPTPEAQSAPAPSPRQSGGRNWSTGGFNSAVNDQGGDGGSGGGSSGGGASAAGSSSGATSGGGSGGGGSGGGSSNDSGGGGGGDRSMSPD